MTRVKTRPPSPAVVPAREVPAEQRTDPVAPKVARVVMAGTRRAAARAGTRAQVARAQVARAETRVAPPRARVAPPRARVAPPRAQVARAWAARRPWECAKLAFRTGSKSKSPVLATPIRAKAPSMSK